MQGVHSGCANLGLHQHRANTARSLPGRQPQRIYIQPQRYLKVASVAVGGRLAPPSWAPLPLPAPQPLPKQRPLPPTQVTGETLKDVLSFFRSQHIECDYWLSADLVEGEIPAALRGTLFRNGPGQLEVFGQKINQPFDGDGMLTRFTFVDGKAHFSSRYVRTRAFQEEQAAGRMLHSGAFSTGNPSGSRFNNPLNLVVKNVANTGVLQWAGQLFALHESGLPHRLEPASLRTWGETNLADSIDGKGPFAAHYRIMHEADGSKRWVAFGSTVTRLDSRTVFYEYAEDGSLLHKTVRKIKNGAFGFFHDMAVTEHYYVLLHNPSRLDFRKFFFEYCSGRCGIAECIVYDPTLAMRIHLVPRPGRSGAARQQQEFQTEPFFAFHHVNAFEQGDQVVIDTLGWDSVSFCRMNLDAIDISIFQGGQRSELNRLVVDTAADSVHRRSLSHRCCEFPAISAAANGRRHRHTYLSASSIDDPFHWGPNQVLTKVTFSEDGDAATAQPSIELWAPGSRCFTQEPVFVSRPGGEAEDDGWVLLTVNDAGSGRTDLCILDAQRIAEGPVCTLHLPHHIPPDLHGSWAADAVHVTPPQRMPTRWRPCVNTIRH